MNQHAKDEQILRFGNLIFGEVGTKDKETKRMVGSTVMNRVNDKKHRYGKGIEGVMDKKSAYFARRGNEYKKAATLKLNKEEEKNYDDSLDMAQNLYEGKTKPVKGTHFLRSKEGSAYKGKMNFIKKVGPYDVFDE